MNKRYPSLLILLLSCSVFSTQLSAAQVNLETSPLFLTATSKPNVMLIMDDSGSMDWEISIPDTSDGVLWWNTVVDSFVGVETAGQLNINLSSQSNSPWHRYQYLFPNGTGIDQRSYGDNWTAKRDLALPPFKQFGYARSSAYNGAYYNHNVTYHPWATSLFGGVPFSNANPAAAWSDPDIGDLGDNNTAVLNLISAVQSVAADWVFGVFDGMTIPAGVTYDAGAGWQTASVDMLQSSDQLVGVQYYPATYYVLDAQNSYRIDGVTKSCATPDYQDYLAFKNAPSSLQLVDALGPDGRCLNKIEIRSATSSYAHNGARSDCAASVSCSYAEEAQNFANWFSFYRKRYLTLRGAMGEVFANLTGLRTGMFTINDLDDGLVGDISMLDLDEAADNMTLFDGIYALGNSGGTPNRQALHHAGQQFMRTDVDAPIIDACQQNFALQFTDGYSYINQDSAVGNTDSAAGAPYADNSSNTLADIAYHYYETTLRGGASFPAGQLNLPAACSQANPPAYLDCNSNLHMNTYGIVLGGVGRSVFGVDQGGLVRTTVADAFANPPLWPDVNAQRNATQIDDLYHATVNGRGEMYRATSAGELQVALESALYQIGDSTGNAVKVMSNSSALSQNELVYVARYNSHRWSGDVRAYGLANGNLTGPAHWNATDWLDAMPPAVPALSPAQRNIFTYDGSLGKRFLWTDLTAVQQADLNMAAGGVGQEALNYIRGDRTKDGNGYRARASVLGDFIHSNLVYVGKPPLKWPDTPSFHASVGPTRYSEFRAHLLANPRKEMVYLGANDGMLHGFVASSGQADSGKELLAYIPAGVYSTEATKGLHFLTDVNYTHQFYVDLSPAVSDVILKGRWSTLLIGGLRSGGRSIFALDVTDPAAFSNTAPSAANTVLWEFSEADLGYTYSKPSIVKLNNGKWGAIFGNGYNDSGSGQAQLFIVEIDKTGAWQLGSNYYKLSTAVGSTASPNGLATPAVVDLDGNGTGDRVYAGDLLGNLWAFDISSASAGNWQSAYPAAGSPPVPLFKAKDGTADTNPQSIVVQPIAVRHPSQATDLLNPPNVMLFFGTGRYLGASDVGDHSEQTYYGVWDKGESDLTRADLQRQTVINNTATNANGDLLRVLSDHQVDYATQRGWFFDLPDAGERSILKAYVRGDVVYYNTWIPDNAVCAPGGSGYLMSVNQVTGGEPDKPAFGLNPGAVDNSDKVNNKSPAGQRVGFLPSESGFLGDYQLTGTVQVDDQSGGDHIEERRLPELDLFRTGRLSWQELGRD